MGRKEAPRGIMEWVQGLEPLDWVTRRIVGWCSGYVFCLWRPRAAIFGSAVGATGFSRKRVYNNSAVAVVLELPFMTLNLCVSGHEFHAVLRDGTSTSRKKKNVEWLRCLKIRVVIQLSSEVN